MKIFFNEKMISDQSRSGSKSSLKPKLFLEFLQTSIHIANNNLIEIVESAPVAKNDLYQIHLKEYVDGVFAGKLANGFMNYDLQLAESCRFTVGSLYDATLHALNSKEITFSPTSGFHHAGFERNGGFCTFNGLVFVAQKLSVERNIKLAIVDLDYHYPDGTIDILAKLGNPKIFHYFVSGQLKGNDYLNNLAEILFTLKTLAKPDVIVFQLAADTYIDDPLGGSLSLEELKLRDKMIADFYLDFKIPMSWCLGGGYAQDYNITLAIHGNTFKEFLAVEEKLRGLNTNQKKAS